MSTAKEKIEEIYSKEDWKNIFLKGYEESGCTQHLSKETITNVQFYNEHEDEILDYFEDTYKGPEPLIEKIIKMAAYDIIMVKSISVQYFVEMYSCEVVGIPFNGEMDPRHQRKKLREMGIFDYQEGMMTPQPPDFKRKKGSAHGVKWTETKII